jgi:hypothetical protein
MIFRQIVVSVALGLGLAAGVSACGDETEAQRLGVGAECTTNEDCAETAPTCLAFKGGYCGVDDCTADADCPSGSACVTHTDGVNYCFLICDAKADCNVDRTAEHEANCASNVTWVEDKPEKACVPPSGN